MKYLAAECYLPHAAPMVMLEQVLEVEEHAARCQVRVSKEGVLAPFLDEQGRLPSWFALELMAQTIGVWSGWHASQGGSAPRLGMLLGGRGLKCSLPTFPADALLTVSASMLLQDERLASFECAISMNQQGNPESKPVAQARLNTYQPDAEELQTLFLKKPRQETPLQGSAT